MAWRRVQDLPGDAERLVSDAVGIDAVIVNGVVLRKDNRDMVSDADLPGRLLRGGCASSAETAA